MAFNKSNWTLALGNNQTFQCLLDAGYIVILISGYPKKHCGPLVKNHVWRSGD